MVKQIKANRMNHRIWHFGISVCEVSKYILNIFVVFAHKWQMAQNGKLFLTVRPTGKPTAPV